MARIAVIGSGFSGLSAASYLSAAGHDVSVFEKNERAGGRARQFREAGYCFDMGPSWYWMPSVFERFFADFNCKPSDFYQLELLDPSFDMVFEEDTLRVPSAYPELCQLFESIEKGSSGRLDRFMREAQFKYEIGMEKLVYRPGLSLAEFMDAAFLKRALRLQVFSSFSKHVQGHFSDPRLIALMEFPVLFLGAMPQQTPALYSLMNYAGLKLGTWYPMGGFGSVVDGMQRLASLQGARFYFNTPVEKILAKNGLVEGIRVNGDDLPFDSVLATADYHHVEDKLLPPSYRNYSNTYWSKKVFAPSCLIFYLGVRKRVGLQHHTLFFEEDLATHARDIYKNPRWPERPLFYACCPSRTDPTVAPPGHENLFLLMPVAAGIEDSDQIREKYFRIMIKRIEKLIGEEITSFIDYQKSYCINDFITDYNSYKGNAYGLANTLLQTAILKPKIRNRQLRNLFYAGQLTVPGPGVPPSIISGKIAATQLIQYLKKHSHETRVR